MDPSIDSKHEQHDIDMGVEPKIGGKPPKMDGLFHGKPY